MAKKKARVISVVNEKGGVGKTATVVNLAAAFSLMGKKALVVDCDPQFNATRNLGVDPQSVGITTYDIMTAKETPDLDQAVTQTAWPGLFLIPSTVDLAGAEMELMEGAEETARQFMLRRLAPLEERFDYILLDPPPTLGLLTINVFTFAQEVVIPCQTHPFALGALDDLLDTLEMVKEINPGLQLTGLAPTMFDSRTKVAKNVLAAMLEDPRFKGKVFKTVIRFNSAVAESSGLGKPVVFYRKKSYGALDYQALAKELTRRKPKEK